MSELKLLCRIPAEQTPIAEAIQAAGGVPVIDLTAAPDVEVVVPEGAWIRVRVGEPAPGAGPVILVGDDAQPLDGRPCWAEITRPQAVPAGFVGVILRGAAVGGPGSARPGMSLLRSMPSDTTVILEAALNPQAAQEAVSAGARGVLLADELLAQSALQAPPNIAARIERAGPGTDHQINGFRVQASPLSAGLRRLLGGEDPWSVTAGWWSADDPNNVPIPAGAGVVVGRTLAELYPTIDRLLAAYLSAMESVGTKDAAPATADASAVAGGTQPEAEDAVAIVGMGVRLPDAESVEAYWSNLVNGHSSIREVPRDRWEPELYWSEDRKAPDKTYTKIGGFIEGFTFHPRRFRIPPMMAKMLDPVQQLALESVGDALEDAGYGSDVDFDRTRVAVILGNSMGGEITDEYAVRTHYPMVQQALARVPAIAALPRATRDQLFKDFEEGVKAELPPINEDSMPGELPNVIAGRIANAFNLTGPNFTCDAACAGSMAAVQASVKGLLDHEFDMAVTGGSDRSMAVPTYVKFAKIGALSPDHSAPFDASANGFVMGEGCGVLVLKRLSDAVADGDRIYAVIRGVGGSSDGKGKGIMAPNPRGQRLALARAYASAGISPHEVDLIECHGTSTFVGDGVELKTISAFIGAGQRDATDPIRVGSVKSNIGHLKSAAGAASLIKTALSLYHKTLPPTLNYKTPREDVDLSTVPLKVQTTTEPWQTTRRRRAGVSAFGFGGINYHVVLEEHKVDDPRPVVQNGIGLPNGLWGVSADTAAQLVERLEMDKPPVYSRFAPVRLVAADSAPREEQVERALGVLRKGRSANMLRTRGIHVEQDSFPGKVAFLFTGQGSQYIDMGLDLAEVYPIVRETFEEAEVILRDELPRPLTSYIRRDPRIPKEEQFEALRATEISQPATLTLDVALLRLLASYGVYPDMVAGHSLGEYAAAVAAGMLSFKDALIAVSARGREMASVKIDDPGKMAGVSTNEDKVADILKDIDGYVVAANKNCPTQTVIAGESTAVLQAMERFKEAGINTIPLPVSHAFHSRIVAPASEPFKRVLKRLDVRPPLRPFSTNVDASLYSTDPAHRDAIIDNLALQIASPVEWIKQIEAMYASGARIFVECGPKRALTGFVATILRRHEHRAIFTNHPKRGGVESFREALAALVALKQPVRAAPGSPELFADLPDGAASPVHRAPAPSMQPILDVLSAHLPGFNPADASDPEAIATILSQALANGVGQPAAGPIAGLPTALFEALSAGAVRSGLASADAQAFARQIAPSVASMVAAMRDAIQPHVTPQIAPQVATTAPAAPPVAVTGGGLMPLTEVVCSGASVGLPGGREVFAEDNFESIFNGDVRITRISETAQDRILDKNIVRLQKDAQTGQGEFVPVTKRDEVLHLAGQKSHFDPVEDYGLDARRVRALDICSQLAFAAGIEALRDAGVPLVQTYRETSKGRRLPGRVMLPESMRDTTGVIFASAFPGLSRFADLIRNNGDGGEARFERAFLFQVLSMGHSQLAELIGARGPNTQVNAACASTTQAVGIASDWIRAGRADRVVIVGADDVTNDALLEWVGAGFLVTGAATTSKKVEEAALPFDRRRHGMILGMGAVGMVIEKARDVQARGMVPIARLLSSRFNNSAYHGTRLDPHHIADEVSALVNEAARNANTTPEKMAKQTVFMSHETYTPARGGSAAAEISSLRHAFGASAGEVVITNTKGFTGHAMGASIEDAVVLKALQHTRVPPIPHLKEPDPDLGDLRMSPGGSFPVRYGLRLAAGFGSQIALLAWEKVADGDARTPQPAVYRKWLSDISGIQHPTTVIENRTLKVVEGEPVESPVEQPATAPAAAPQPAASAAAIPSGAVLDEIMKVISEKTGYGVDELEADYELEADLGVDTVKQAEIFGVIRDRYQLPQEDDFRLADYPTIEKLAGWVSERVGDTPAPVSASVTTESVTTESVTTESAPDAPAASAADVLGVVLSVISEKTGYDVEELEVDYELEADLGVDTVKQAEIFGVIRDRYELPQEDDFRLADYPTIEKLAGWVSERVGGSAPAVAPAPAPTPVPTKEPVPAAVSAPVSAVEPVPVPVSVPPSAAPASVLPILTRIISEKTGYGVDELEADYELEADLGVDTVKQAEIFGEVRDELGLARDDDFRLADYPTIAGLASYLQEQVSDGSTGPVLVPMNEDDAPTPEVSVKPSAANADLFEVPEPQSLPAASLSAPAPLPVVDEDTADGELPESFRIRRPVLVSRPAWFEGSLAGRAVEVLGDSALSVSIRAALEKRGAVFSDTPELVVDADTDVLAAFERARALDGARPVGWLCATRLGADPSMVPAEIGARAGARAGFTKALGREWERCSARVVDVASYVDDAVAAEIFCNELANLQGATEVFRDEHQRMVMALQTEPRPQGVGALKGEPVIVLTGGTRGITARVALELARRGRCRLALFARTAPGEAPLDEAATRKHIREELKAEGERGTPAQIETRMRPLRRAEEARQNIEQLRAAGAEVRFWSVNLADPAAVKRTMDSVRGFWGRIDGVIHGAGVEESRLIGDKDLSAFARVFDGKALGGLALIGALEDDAWFVSMGSIAGRFGNQGQVDYAAANEAMARVCLGRPRSLHVDWTAWGDVGMAVRGGMERLLTERGMELLPAAAGASLLVDMVLAGMWGEMVVAGQLGDLSIAADHPMLDHFRYDGDGVSAGRELSLSRDPWILDHAIDGTPVLPGVMGLEMMAAAAQLCALGMSPTSVREARFTAPVKLYGDAPTMLHIEAAPFDAETVQVRLSSSRVSRAGKTIRAEHFEAIIELSDIEPPSPLPPAILAELSLDRAGIYQRFFHGPRFQVLAEVVGVAQDGLEAEVRVDHAGLPGGLLTGPLLLEAAFQAAGMHRMIVDGEMALPSGFTSVALVRTPEEGAELWATVRRRGDRYDVDIDNNDGAVLMLRGFEMTKLDDLPPEDRIDAPEDGWPVAVVAQARFEAPPRVMSEDEEAKLTARGTPRRQRDRIAGRIAAKLAVSALTGAAPLTFTIDNLPSGQPAPTGVAAQLSLAHRDGTGWAVATPRGAPGIDVELIEARPASFAETWYTPEERALCQGDAMRESLIWACKEATLKALGTGLRLPTRSVEVIGIVGRRAQVRLTGDAETRHAVLGGGRLTVRWRRFGEEIVAIAFIEAQDRGRTHGESAA